MYTYDGLLDSNIISTCAPSPTPRPLPIHKASVKIPVPLLVEVKTQLRLEAPTPLLTFASHPARPPSNHDETLERGERR
jgi:hypothetical protein